MACLAIHADRITEEMASLLLVGESLVPVDTLEGIEERYEVLADQLDWIEIGAASRGEAS